MPSLHDGLAIGDLVSSGGESFAYCVDARGVVGSVTLDSGATLGNSAVLYPGAHLREGALVGNDTVLATGVELPPRVRQQGAARYAADAGKQADVEAGDGGKGSGGAAMPVVQVPRLHALRVVAVQLVVGPIEALLRWSVASFVLLVALEGAGAWAILVWFAV